MTDLPFDEWQEHKGKLCRLRSKSCEIEHEDTELAVAPECDLSIQDFQLGCTHNGQRVLRAAISFCERHRLLLSDRAAVLREQLDIQLIPLLQLDGTATKEYENGGISAETRRCHNGYIAVQAGIRDELLTCLSQRVNQEWREVSPAIS